MVRGHAGLRARAGRLQGGPGHPADGHVRRGGAGATRGGQWVHEVGPANFNKNNQSCKINYFK